MTVDQLLDNLRKNPILKGLTFSNIHWDFSAANYNGILQHITFENCTFENVFFSSFENEDVLIEFKSCDFKSSNRTLFNRIKCYTLKFTKCDFHEILVGHSSFSDLKFSENKAKLIHINTCKSESLNIGNLHPNIENLILFDIDSQEIVVLSDHSIDHLTIQQIKRANIIGDFKKVTFDSNGCENIRFESLRPTNKSLFTSDIGSFEIVSLNFPGHLSIDNVNIEKLLLTDVSSPSGGISLNGVAIKDCDISGCSFSKIYWNQVHFNGELSIENSDLSGLRMAHVKWPSGKRVSNSFLEDRIVWGYRWRKLKSEDKYDANELVDLQNERDLYRQLKAACNANHNHIEALAFYRNEMRLYWKEIRINGGTSTTDNLLIFINRWVSDFGQSWLLPLCWLLGINLLFYFG